jgi:glycosyltransferase involved in cell wall biosynthesis
VVFLDHVACLSGGEISLLRLVGAIRSDVDAHVILGEDGPLRQRLEAAGATVEVLPMAADLREVRRSQVRPARLSPRPLWGLARHVWALARRLRELEPAIVHTNSLKAALYGGVAGRLAHVPVVWHIRDRIADDYLPRAAVTLVRMAAHVLPSMVVANSRATLAELPACHRRDSLLDRVMPEIVPVFPPCGPRAGGPLLIGILGRLAPWKGQHVFLEAFAQAFAADNAQAWLIGNALFGEQDYEAGLRERAVALGIADQVVWRGFRDDIAAELAQLDIVVHASTTGEPFGQVIIEGMSAGLPVIATAAGGPLEIITDGVDGLLVQPGDPTALAVAMATLAADPAARRRLGAAGRQSSRRYSPDAARVRLLEIYDHVLGRRAVTARGSATRPR